MQLHEFIALLQAKGCQPRLRPNGQWTSRCPAHADAVPSLSVAEGEKGIVVHCFAGCSVEQVCDALGITLSDLRTDRDFERRITYEVRNPDGMLVAIHERIEHNGKKTFVWRHADGRIAKGDLKVADLPLYGVHRLKEGAEFVVVVEGEKCADALWSVGVPAVATYGATCDPADEPLKQVIERAPTVFLWADNDTLDASIWNGLANGFWIWAQLMSAGLTGVTRQKRADAADAVKLGVDIRALLEAARPFEPPEEAQQNGSTPQTQSLQTQCPFCQISDAELFAKAQPVLEADNPLQAGR